MVKSVSTVASDTVLVVDVQTTGSSPGTGHLLEVAWARLPGAGDTEVFSFLVALPEGEEIPPRISRLTGITADMIRDALPPEEIARLLEPWLRNAHPIAHFAVFEQRWLDHLFSSAGIGGGAFPGIVCTRELARRLYPGLPRKGLRAVAGYLGHTVGEHRRAADHVRATVEVWNRMAPDLLERGIVSFGDLGRFLSSPVPAHEGSWDYMLPREKRLGLPDCPGVYRFLSARGQILYVGKARSLRHRVNSYFTKRKADGKTLELVSQVADLSVSECETPLEAALEEFLRIREYSPQYNIAMRERGLQLVHLDPVLASAVPVPDAEHPVGPVPSGSPSLLLRGFLDTLESGAIPEPSDAGLGYLPPAEGAMEEGVSLFREKWAPPGTALGEILLAGREILRLHRERAKEPEEEPEEDEPEGEVREPATEISAEGVLNGLEWFIAAGARDLRMAAWFRLLGWSSVCWAPRSPGEWRVLDVDGGDLSGTRWAADPEKYPPSDPGRPERQAALDPLLFDLLRVLQSEIRRVHSSGIPLQVIVPGGRRLETEMLDRLLRLV